MRPAPGQMAPEGQGKRVHLSLGAPLAHETAWFHSNPSSFKWPPRRGGALSALGLAACPTPSLSTAYLGGSGLFWLLWTACLAVGLLPLPLASMGVCVPDCVLVLLLAKASSCFRELATLPPIPILVCRLSSEPPQLRVSTPETGWGGVGWGLTSSPAEQPRR